eukprot:m.25027 g.25027  ORF g.25027 m.25027 type:complete len:833 (+) comp28715_c0_seq2:85-2583(+)
MAAKSRSGRGLAILKAFQSLPIARRPGEKELAREIAEKEKADYRKSAKSSDRNANDAQDRKAEENRKIAREPTVGSCGNEAMFFTNYVRVTTDVGGAFQYAVSFRPEIEQQALRGAMIREHEDTVGKAHYYNGNILYLPMHLPKTTTELTSKKQSDGTEVTVLVTFVKFVRAEECVHLFNVIFRRVMRHLKLHLLGDHFFDSSARLLSPQYKLEIWPGYITSIRNCDGGLLLMCDASHKYLRTDTVHDILCEIYERDPAHFQEEATRALVGQVVLTRYNKKTYRIDGIDWDRNAKSTFSDGSGQRISYLSYYRRAHDIQIQDSEQPLLISRNRSRIYGSTPANTPDSFDLIPELSCMTGLHDDLRNDYQAMKNIALNTRLSPADRVIRLQKFLKNVEQNEAACNELAAWGLKLDPDILEVKGRQLPPEKIIMKSLKFEVGPGAEWTQEALQEQMLSTVDLHDWLLVFVNQDQNRAMEFIRMMQTVCPPMGLKVNMPRLLSIGDQRTESFVRCLRQHITTHNFQCVVVIVPTSRDDRYAAIKKLCCIEKPIPSQVILTRTISHPTRIKAVTQKIALQINCKLGGELWSVDIPLKYLMVVGIDVYYDSVSSRFVGALVASTNRGMTKWYSRTCLQEPGQELVDRLTVCFFAALRKYKDLNGTLPERIVIYRDGVQKGRMANVSDYEVPQFISVLNRFGKEYRPKFSVVVVKKRINARMFLPSNRGDEDFVNPHHGAILDHTINGKNWYDFFLVSQRVTQGTVTPSYYIVVYDNSNLKPDYMQRLTYKLTHMYYNWPGTIRVPAPCQYGHKIAVLVGQSLHQNASLELADKLFYL